MNGHVRVGPIESMSWKRKRKRKSKMKRNTKKKIV
jgi:hypothetical protein